MKKLAIGVLMMVLVRIPGLPSGALAAQPPVDADSKALTQTKQGPEPGQGGQGESRTETREGEDSQFRLNALKLERDILRSQADDLQHQLEMAHQDIDSGKKALAEANARLAALEKEKAQLSAAVTEARDQARDLNTKLAAEQVKSATLREDKQRLMSGTTTAKEEIARLQKRASELETQAARAEDLAKRLAERDQELERLRKAAADHDNLTNKVAGLAKDLERTKQRLTTLTEELSARSEELARARQEREHLAQELRRQQEAPKGEESKSVLAPPGIQVAPLPTGEDAAKTRREQPRVEVAPPEDRRIADEPARSVANGPAPKTVSKDKDSVLQRLMTAHAPLAKSLDSEISKGELSVQQERDRLTISVADRALFDTGQTHVKPDGLKLLKKVSDVLKTVPDKQVRVESHPEDVIVKQKERNGSSWELFTARATSIMQRLVEDGGLESGQVSLAVSSDFRIGANGTEESRSPAHRTEIIVSPKN